MSACGSRKLEGEEGAACSFCFAGALNWMIE